MLLANVFSPPGIASRTFGMPGKCSPSKSQGLQVQKISDWLKLNFGLYLLLHEPILSHKADATPFSVGPNVPLNKAE